MRHRVIVGLVAAFALSLVVGCGSTPTTAPTLAGPPSPPPGPGQPKVASPQPPGPKGID